MLTFDILRVPHLSGFSWQEDVYDGMEYAGGIGMFADWEDDIPDGPALIFYDVPSAPRSAFGLPVHRYSLMLYFEFYQNFDRIRLTSSPQDWTL